jgi:hypothetical protein
LGAALMPRLEDMKTWRDRLGHSGLRSFTDAQGHIWLEQNQAKASKSAKLAREGHEVAWEFEKPGGGYTGRILVDGQIYSTSEATKKFLQPVKRDTNR